MEIFFADRVEGSLCFLGAEESAHCVRVLRHRAGDEICVSDGCGSLLHCSLKDASSSSATAVIVSTEENWGLHPYHLELAVCPTKNIDRYEWMAEKATETGLDILTPLIGERSERKVLKTERLKRIVFSAAKQSLKGRIPEVAEPLTVMDYIRNADSSRLRLIAYCLDDEKKRISVREVLERNGNDRISILIGPEGDFSPTEVEAALAAGFIPVHLGPSRLRTETAALVSAGAVYSRYCL